MSPATVATSTDDNSTAYGIQRKGFYAEGLWWAFYIDGTDAVWEWSNDGADWSNAPTSIGACTSGWALSVWFDGTYVHYVRYNVNDLFYRRGTPVNDGTITWSAVEQTVYDGAGDDVYFHPCITVDSSGYVWLGAGYFNGVTRYPYVLKNDNNDGTWATDFAYKLSVRSDSYWKVLPVSLTSNKVYVIYCSNADPPAGQLYNAGWGAEETDLGDFDIEDGNGFSAVADGDNIHFVYNRDVTYQIRHNERVWGVGWNAADVLVQDGVTATCGPGLSIIPSSGDLFCFWTSTVTDHVYYKRYTSSAWDPAPTDWIDESVDHIDNDYLISPFYQDYTLNLIGVIYQSRFLSPYKVRFEILDAPPILYAEKIATFSIAVDGVWTDYDLHTLQGVPKGRVAEIVCANKNEGAARVAGVRTDGSGLDRYIDIHEAEGLGVTTSTMFVKCHETTGLIECYSEIQGDVDFYLLGYFDADVDFTESITSLGQPGLAWADLDLTASGVPDDAVVQILMGNEADAACFFAGVRANGSALERGYTLDEAEADGWTPLSMVVQSDAGAVIEWKGGSVTDVTMWLLGWFSVGVSFTEGFTDYSPAADSTWTEKTIAESAAYSVVAFALVHQDSGAETFCGLREQGSALARMIEEHEAEGGSSTGFQACVLLDGDKKCKVFCEDASEAQFSYTGYFVIVVVPVGWTGKISGVTNPAKIMGVDVANIATVKGVA